MANATPWPRLAAAALAGDAVSATWQDGASIPMPFLWLRHNCDCPECVVRQTGEKRYRIVWAPADLRPAAAAVDAEADCLVVDWPDGHRSRYRSAMLRELMVCSKPAVRYWDCRFAPRRFDFEAFLDDDDSAARAIAEFLASGVCVLTGAPTAPGSVERLCPRLGPIREVLFERIHNVQLDPAGYNIAHTSEDVPPHNDMVSYSWPPSVQALHMLANDCAGGESGVVDGFAVLRRFRAEHPAMFETLCIVPVPFRQFDANNETSAAQPVVEVDCEGELRLLRFSNQLMQPLPLWQPKLGEFYQAFRQLAELVAGPGFRVQLRLAAGEVLLVAGHRVLHARTPIVGAGRRHLQDAYFDHDNVRNHYKLLKRQGRIEGRSLDSAHRDDSSGAVRADSSGTAA